MKKKEFIERRGKEAYEKLLEDNRQWEAANRDRHMETTRQWRAANPDRIKANGQERCRKGGKYYKRLKRYQMNGIPHEKGLVRAKHKRIWTPYKRIIAPDSQIHHQWLPNTANYTGVALVEKDQHQHGIIDVIQILEGEITLLTEISHI